MDTILLISQKNAEMENCKQFIEKISQGEQDQESKKLINLLNEKIGLFENLAYNNLEITKERLEKLNEEIYIQSLFYKQTPKKENKKISSLSNLLQKYKTIHDNREFDKTLKSIKNFLLQHPFNSLLITSILIGSLILLNYFGFTIQYFPDIDPQSILYYVIFIVILGFLFSTFFFAIYFLIPFLAKPLLKSDYLKYRNTNLRYILICFIIILPALIVEVSFILAFCGIYQNIKIGIIIAMFFLLSPLFFKNEESQVTFTILYLEIIFLTLVVLNMILVIFLTPNATCISFLIGNITFLSIPFLILFLPLFLPIRTIIFALCILFVTLLALFTNNIIKITKIGNYHLESITLKNNFPFNPKETEKLLCPQNANQESQCMQIIMLNSLDSPQNPQEAYLIKNPKVLSSIGNEYLITLNDKPLIIKKEYILKINPIQTSKKSDDKKAKNQKSKNSTKESE